jgi:hypothetical protein
LVRVRDDSEDDESGDEEPEEGNEKSGEGWESMDEDWNKRNISGWMIPMVFTLTDPPPVCAGNTPSKDQGRQNLGHNSKSSELYCGVQSMNQGWWWNFGELHLNYRLSPKIQAKLQYVASANIYEAEMRSFFEVEDLIISAGITHED